MSCFIRGELRRPRLTFGETIIASIMKTAKTAIDIAVYWFTTRTSSVIFIYYLLFGKEFC